MVVALGAADRQAHEGGGDGLDGDDRQFLGVLAVADDVAAREEAEREHVVGPRLDARADAVADIWVRSVVR